MRLPAEVGKQIELALNQSKGWCMKIVLTGGPSGGKTALTQILQKEFGNLVALVPESASLLFRGGYPRAKTADTMVCQQRAIYFLQREIETATSLQFPNQILICDRGTLDGLAYWPAQSKTSFFDSLQTTKEAELARYDLVIHLETAGQQYYDTGNLLRIESYVDAVKIDGAIQTVWKEHPNRVIIVNSKSFHIKVQQVIELTQKTIQLFQEKGKIA
jgi:nicotinamide riboside kinase